MKETINKKVYDTDEAVDLGHKFCGLFGAPDGYEERLFIAEDGTYFIYGVGGPESKYSEPAIEVVSDEQAEEWKKDNE